MRDVVQKRVGSEPLEHNAGGAEDDGAAVSSGPLGLADLAADRRATVFAQDLLKSATS